MRWRGREQSRNVEDRRGMRTPMAIGGGGLGILILAAIALFMGADPNQIRQFLGQVQQGAPQAQQAPGVDDEAKEFISVILKSTEDVWTQLFRESVEGGAYQPPVLTLFDGRVQSGCGVAASAVGPFYCPADRKVYMDPTFFDELSRRHNAPGDFAQAYVIAHEVAHHVQLLLGFSDIVQRAREQGNELVSNQASVRLELQADFLAGVWAHHAEKHYDLLEEGDIQEGIHAANQIGDDTLMRQAGAPVVPARFTHGTSAQRTRWFSAGLRSGDILQCRQLFELDYDQL